MQADGSSVWTCTQARFYSYTPPYRVTMQWTVYLTATTPASPSPFPLFWLSTRPDPLTFTVPAGTPYVKLNSNNTGFFRVLYDAASYASLSAALNRPGYSGIYHDDRLGLVSDAFVLSGVGLQSWPATLNLSLFLQHELSFPVWQVAYPSLLSVYQLLKFHNSTARLYYEQYMAQCMSGAAAHLDLSRTVAPSASDAILESVLGLAMVRFNVSGRVGALKALFTELYAGRLQVADINSNLIDLVLEAGVVDGTQPSAWLWVYQRFYLSKLQALYNGTQDDPLASLAFPNIVRALSAAQRASELQQLLDWLFDSSHIAPQHIPTVLQAVAYNHIGLPLVNTWLTQDDHFITLLAYLTNTSAITQQQRSSTMQTIIAYNTQPDDIQRLATFIAQANQTTAIPAQIANGIRTGFDAAHANVEWLRVNYEPIKQYLEDGAWRRQS